MDDARLRPPVGNDLVVRFPNELVTFFLDTGMAAARPVCLSCLPGSTLEPGFPSTPPRKWERKRTLHQKFLIVHVILRLPMVLDRKAYGTRIEEMATGQRTDLPKHKTTVT